MTPQPADSIPTGIGPLDAALGGLPRGRVVELFGGPGTGKTTIALQAVATVQRNGGAAAWIDAEHSFDPAFASRAGVRTEDLPVAQPVSAEQAFEIARRLALSRAIDLIVVDSAAALVPEVELQTGIGEGSHGTQSRAISSGLRKLGAALRTGGAAALFLNQTRASEHADTSAGGAPLKLFACARVCLIAATSGRIRFRVLKNKAAGAFAEGELTWEDGRGFVESP